MSILDILSSDELIDFISKTNQSLAKTGTLLDDYSLVRTVSLWQDREQRVDVQLTEDEMRELYTTLDYLPLQRYISGVSSLVREDLKKQNESMYGFVNKVTEW